MEVPEANMIVKVQKALNPPDSAVLIYNEDRSLMLELSAEAFEEETGLKISEVGEKNYHWAIYAPERGTLDIDFKRPIEPLLTQHLDW